MTAAEWKAQWKRLEHLRSSGDADRGELEAEWFSQLRHYHVEAVEYGITKLIGHTKDTFLPGLGLLKDFIQQKFDRYQRTDGKCPTCHGSSWVSAPAFKSNGIIYANVVQRCPDCGIPSPQVDDRGHRQRLTDLELHEYQAGRYGRNIQPEGLEAKPLSAEAAEAHRASMRASLEQLRRKLFPAREEIA